MVRYSEALIEFAAQAQSGMCADQRDAQGNPTFLRTLVNEKSAAAVWAPRGRLSALRVFPSKSVACGACVR